MLFISSESVCRTVGKEEGIWRSEVGRDKDKEIQ